MMATKGLLWIVLTCCWFVFTNGSRQGFYNIAHMTNNIESVIWAMKQGANSVEIDLQFKTDGTPFEVFHGSPCDCTCMCPLGLCHVVYPNSVCVQLEKTAKNPCHAKTEVKKLLRAIASQSNQVAMVLIDSKLTDFGKKMSRRTQQVAAKKVISLLEAELFGRGFRGQVIIGAPYFHSFPYIEEIAKTSSKFKHRIHFTIDGKNMVQTKFILSFDYNKNIVYNVGLSACSPKAEADFKTSKLALINTVKGAFGMAYTWTVDRQNTMSYYINYFSGIITNYPASLAAVLKKNNFYLARPTDVIMPSVTENVIQNGALIPTCECSYSPGGCKITKKAPPGFACQCTYPFLWTCTGWVVSCLDRRSQVCKSPDLSQLACVQGRGDCGGY